MPPQEQESAAALDQSGVWRKVAARRPGDHRGPPPGGGGTQFIVSISAGSIPSRREIAPCCFFIVKEKLAPL